MGSKKTTKELEIDKTEKLKEDIFKITNDTDLLKDEDLLKVMLYYMGFDYFYENFREYVNSSNDEESLSSLKNYLLKNYVFKQDKKIKK